VRVIWHTKFYKGRFVVSGMARIKCDGDSREIPDGSPIKSACKELGIVFGCEDGLCGACTTSVLSGGENLGEPNAKELERGMHKGKRLMCQCKISGGEIELDQ
jgi:ferredoxin